MAKKSSKTRTLPDGSQQHDYIEPGSPEHAAYLGIRKATKGDDPELVIEGYTLTDPYPLGVIGWSKEYRREWLRQKVSGLLTKPPEIQSEDRQAEHYAPPMWSPRTEDESPVTGII
jgi:hypothetical protein